MQITSNSLYNFGSYEIKINDKEVLVYEEDKETKKSLALAAKKEQQAKQKSKASDELTPDELRLVQDLQARDSEVKAHEAAHQAAGGGMTGAASYTYQQGPDGKMYAIGGEVSITMKSGSTPEETIANARQIAAAAMAAGSPSPQDFAVASSARVMEMRALQQLAKQTQEEMSGKNTYTNEAKKSNTQDRDFNKLSGFDFSA